VELGPSFGTGAFISHGTAGIQKYVTPEVGFFFVLAYVESIAFPVDFPIEMSNLVARDILAVLFEFDAEPLVGRAVQPGAKALDHSPRQHLMVGKPREILRV
jgi:hypothetical protein